MASRPVVYRPRGRASRIGAAVEVADTTRVSPAPADLDIPEAAAVRNQAAPGEPKRRAAWYAHTVGASGGET